MRLKSSSSVTSTGPLPFGLTSAMPFSKSRRYTPFCHAVVVGGLDGLAELGVVFVEPRDATVALRSSVNAK